MKSTPFLDAVLEPVTAFIDEAVDALVAGKSLSLTAESLIRAIELVPGAGRVAVFLADRGEAEFKFVAGPSFTPDEVETLRHMLAEAATETLEASVLEADFGKMNGNRQELRIFPLSVPKERPAALLVTARDQIGDQTALVFDEFMDQIVRLAGVVVEDRRLRARMLEQQSVLRALVGAAPDAIIRIDRYGTVLDYMGRAEALFGWRPEEIVGANVAKLMPEPHASRHGDYVESFLETGKRKLPDFGRRLTAMRKDGSTFPVEIALSHLPGYETAEFIGIVRDISGRVEREQELDGMREALDDATRQSALGELAATIAHELNQPLTAIANYMDALELRLARLDHDDRDRLVELARKAGAQARLGGEIIRRTRRMATKGESEPVVNDFHTAISEALALVSQTPSARGVRIETRQSGEDGRARFDRVQMQQVLINLASNAFRAMEDSERRCLTVETVVGGDTARLVVSDTGPGVAEADRPKLFERFFRRSGDGMGLGLAVVKRIVAAHGGQIAVDDNPGGGAQFRLNIPRHLDLRTEA